MITDVDLYIKGLIEEADRIKASGKRFLYRPNEELSYTVVQYTIIYFQNNSAYRLEMKKCASCKNTYEIIIEIL